MKNNFPKFIAGLAIFLLGWNYATADDYKLNNPIGDDGYYIVKWDMEKDTWATSNDMEYDETFTFAIDITGNQYLIDAVQNGTQAIAFHKYVESSYNNPYNDGTNRIKRIKGNIYGATYNFKQIDSGKNPTYIYAEFWRASDWDWNGRKRIVSPNKSALFKFASNTDAASPAYTQAQINYDGGIFNFKQNGYAAAGAVKHTVTFNYNDGATANSTKDVHSGSAVTKPADPERTGYEFKGWKIGNAGYDFSKSVYYAITLVADWEEQPTSLTSVSVSPTTMKMIEGGESQTITPSYEPSSLEGITYQWSVSPTGVVTVNNGVVTPVAKGTATITCTATDTGGTSKSATCTVTVKGEDEDCEMVWKDLFNGKGEITNAFDPSGQSEPATIRIVKFRFNNVNNKCSGNPWMADVDGILKGMPEASDGSDQWYEIPAGSGNYSTTLYYLQNVKSGRYLYRGVDKKSMGGWTAYLPSTNATNAKTDEYKWFYISDNNGKHLSCYEGYTGSVGSTGENNGAYIIHNRNWEDQNTWSNCPIPALACGRYDNGNLGSWTSRYEELKEVRTDAPNPNYKAATITKDDVTYYRFAANGTMTCTLTDKVLKVGDKISVYCYNTASSTVAGELRIGSTKVADISLAAGVSTYEYTIAAAGGTQIVVATSNADFCVAGVQVQREEPDVEKVQVMAWDTDLSEGITAKVNDETITHTATAKGSGIISYSSSDTEVATVNATTGVVTKVGAGDAVITASVEQEGCYAAGSISYELHLTDLPKPTISFTTVPTEAPQGSVQTVVVTTAGGADFTLAISEGTGATLNIVEQTETSITATLSMGAEATDIELTASTKRVDGQYAQATKTATVAVGACFSDGADIFNFTFTSSSAASAQTAEGIIGGSVDQTALGTKGTEDNPATVAIKKLKFTNQFVTDVNSTAQITTGKTDHSDEWYMYPAGTYDNKQMYYLKNVASGQWLYKDKSVFYGPNGGWKYYAVRTSTTNEQTDVYKWMEVSKDNKKRFANRESYVSKDHEHTHNMRPCITEAANEWKTPYVGAGLSGHQGNQEWDSELVDVENVANPDMIKSVEYNSKTYYIISSEGKITINCDLKAGDVITLDMYNRQTKADASATITISEDATKYEYTTTNEYLCIHGITIHREKVGEFVTPTLSFAEANVTCDLQNSGASYTQVPTSDVTTVATMTYASDNAKATVDAAGKVTLENDIEHGTLITITATLPAVGCYNETTTSYTIRVKNIVEGVLQAMIDATPAKGTLVIEDDFIGQDAVISKEIILDGQDHVIGNMTITGEGRLTLSSGLQVADLNLWANENDNAMSAQMTGEANLTIGGDVWFDVDFEDGAATEYGWYTLGVPFSVAADGVFYKSEATRTHATRGVDYVIYTYNSNKRAAGQKGWEKYTGAMNANTLYLITLNDDLGVSTFSFKMAEGSTLGGDAGIALHEYAAANPVNAGWNGVANSTLQYSTVTFSGDKVQVYNHDNDAFVALETEGSAFVVGSAFFAQVAEEETLLLAATEEGTLHAPRRAAAEQMSEIKVRLGQDTHSYIDQIYLSANDEATNSYEIGHDLVKMTYGTAKVAQMAIGAYGQQLCDAELPWNEDNTALFPLTITAPAAGTYNLYMANESEADLYLMRNNMVVWNMQNGAYSIDLSKGSCSEYSLMLVRKIENTATGMKNRTDGIQAEKIILNHRMFIVKDGKVVDTLGEAVRVESRE